MREKPTIAEVAQAANVAASTVSRVLNGGYASPEVKARVEKVIQKLGYTPSPTARNLKMGRTGIIGVVVDSSQGPWFTQLLGGVEEALVEKGVSVVLGSLRLHGKRDSNVVRAWITERRVDGLIFARAQRSERPLITLATKADLPMVFVCPDQRTRVGKTIRARNVDAGRDVAQHLLSLGHRRFAFVGGPRDSLDTQDRLEGLKRGLAEDGVDLPRANVTYGKDYHPESGVEYAGRWLKLKRSQAPTAVVLANDAMALGFMRTVQAQGVKIPEDISVVGFDGVPDGALYWPGLTTAAQPTREMGMEACRWILKRVHNPAVLERAPLELPTTLVIRESTAGVTKKRTSPKRR